jgi:hypothetical protein
VVFEIKRSRSKKLLEIAIWPISSQDNSSQVKARRKMGDPIYRVVGFERIEPYILLVRFDDGQEQEIDFRPMLVGEMYGPLEDEKMFYQVEIDPEVHTLVWPNGADFDPETLHNWPEYVENMRRLAEQSDIRKTQAM